MNDTTDDRHLLDGIERSPDEQLINNKHLPEISPYLELPLRSLEQVLRARRLLEERCRAIARQPM
jgi:hypothetical protein